MMQRMQTIYRWTNTRVVPTIFTLLLMLLLVLSSRTTNSFVVLVDALTVTQPTSITRFGSFHASSTINSRSWHHSNLCRTTDPYRTPISPNRRSNLNKSTYCAIGQSTSETTVNTGVNTRHYRIQKWRMLLAKKFRKDVSDNVHIFDRPNNVHTLSTTSNNKATKASTGLHMTTTSSEIKMQKEREIINHTTKAAKSPFRGLLLGFAVSILCNHMTSRVANAAVLSSVAIAATSAGSTAATAASTSGILPSFNNYQLTIVVAMIILNAIGNISFAVVVTGIRTFASWYMMNLDTFPLVTKAVTAGVIGIFGDYMAQWLEYLVLERKNDQKTRHQQLTRQSTTMLRSNNIFDLTLLSHTVTNALSINGNYHFRRGLSILADGMLISGPLMHIGYNYFETIVPISGAGGMSFLGMSSSTIAALSHVFADSIVLDSIFIASTFIMTGLFEGYSPKQLIPHFKMDYIPSLKASWLTSLALLPIEFVCFRFLPLSFRVLAVNFIDVVWDAVISFMAHRNRNLKTHTSNSNTDGIGIDNSRIENIIINDSCMKNHNTDMVVQYSYQDKNNNRSAILN
jgi:Mpv17 / PMP22 family